MPIFDTPHRGVRSRHDTGVFTRHELSNGIVVWLQKSPVLLTEEGILVAYYKNVGDVLDPAGKEGLAHFLEHMPFKGTAKYADNQILTDMVRSRGGGMNAATARYYTKYHVGMPGSDFATAVDVLGDLLLAPQMRLEDFETERGVIESERQRRFEHGAALASHDVDELLFGKHPAMTWGIGSADSIQAITLDDVLAFWSQYYHAGNLHLVVGGTFAERPDCLELLEERFKAMERRDPVILDLPALPVPPPGLQRLSDPRYGRERFNLEWVLPGAPTTASLDALDLLTAAYAGGMDSPLAVELRDKRGLVYESGLMDGGRVSTLATRVSLELPISPEAYEEVAPVAMQLLKELSDERLAAVLDRWQVSRLTSFYYPTALCGNLGSELVTRGAPRSIYEDEEETDAIDLDLVHQWRRFLTETPPAVVATSTK